MDWHGHGTSIPHWLYEIFSILWIAVPLFTLGFSTRARSVYIFMVGINLVLSFFGGIGAYTANEMFLLQVGVLATE